MSWEDGMEQFIIYGAGKWGNDIYDFLKYKGLEKLVYCFVDQNADKLKEIDGVSVLEFEDTIGMNIPYLIGVRNTGTEIEEKLTNAHKVYYRSLDFIANQTGEDLVSWNRDYCSYFHMRDAYYDFAESESWLEGFWKEDSPFYKMFQKLDLRNVVELACGRGRHVTRYGEMAGTVTLVDVLEKNITFCRERFKDKNNIFYYCNNGKDLSELRDNTYTSLFTYDAMVHFEMMDIASYLKEAHRVLKPGSYALFHHSNNTSDYKASFSNAVGGRSYMSADIFAYLAYRNNFEIVEQKVIDWGVKDLDCISLLKKPEI